MYFYNKPLYSSTYLQTPAISVYVKSFYCERHMQEAPLHWAGCVSRIDQTLVMLFISSSFSRFRLQVLRGSPAVLPERCPLQAGAAARPVQLQLSSSCKHQLRWDLRFILGNVLVCFHTGNHHKTFPVNKKQVLLTVEPKMIIFTLGVCTKWKEAIQKWLLRILTCCSVSRLLEPDTVTQQSK